MGKLVAVKGCTLQLSSGKASIETSPSQYTTLCGKAAYRGSITIKVSGSKGDKGIVADGNGSGSAVLKGTGSNMLIDGNMAVLEGDNVTVSIKGTKPDDDGGHIAASDTVKVTIQKSGQDYVATS